MESKAINDISLRLLELEQRFESYCTLHEEELREIKVTLKQLREDILRLGRDLETDQDEGAAAAGRDGVSMESASESSSYLTL